MLLDEPTNGLDTDAKDAFKKVVLEEVQRGCTVVVVSHDHTFVEQEVDGLFHMENGVLTAKAVPMLSVKFYKGRRECLILKNY